MADNFDKTAILESFLDEVNAYLPEIEANLDRLQQAPDDVRALQETYRRTHTISGSASMMEFHALAHLAQGMEELLDEALERQQPLSAPTVALLRRSCGRLARVAEHIRTGADDSEIVAEDDQDRAAWRGPGGQAGAGGNTPGALVTPNAFFAGDSSQASAPQAAEPPEWLAAFADPNAQVGATPTTGANGSSPANGFGGGAGKGSSSPSNPLVAASTPGDVPSAPGATPTWGTSQPPLAQQPPQPAANQQEPWATSLSNLPTGAAPAINPLQSFPSPAFGSASNPPTSPAAPPAPTPGAGARGDEPTFDEMLSAFRAPGELTEPRAASTPGAAPSATPGGQYPDPWGRSQTSAIPGATPATGQPAHFDVSDLRTVPSLGSRHGSAQIAGIAGSDFGAPAPASAPIMMGGAPVTQSAADAAATQTALDELRADEDAVRRQVATLGAIVAMMREASEAMEEERAGLSAFLDGSADALDRLEEWVGGQMGLDLRRSPETVRNYLPLSVIWVTTTRLKKLIALLNSASRNLTVTQEQIDETLREFRSALDSFGALSSTLSSIGPTPDGGFSATVAHIAWAPTQQLPQAPAGGVVESRPNSAAPTQETLAPGARAALERSVREELRRSLEDEVREEIAADLRREEEQRLRGELEIQVRRQLLADLAPGLGESSVTVRDGSVHVQTSGPFLAVRPPRQVRVTSEQSPEALEVFRDEALEHLQTITTGIAQLERTPGDMDAVKSIRRAMHTLKGAAGMMGFTTIQRLAHSSEDLLDRLMDGAFALTPAMVSLTLDTAEALDQMVSGGIADTGDQQRLAQSLITRYAAITGAPADLGDLAESGAEGEQESESVAIALGGEDDAAPVPAPSDGVDLSVRLQLSKLDDLVNLFSDLVQHRTTADERTVRLAQLVSEVTRIGSRLREIGTTFETRFETALLPSGRQNGALAGANGAVIPRSPIPGAAQRPGLDNGAGGEFDDLEMDRYNEFHRLLRGLSEGSTDLVALSREMEKLMGELQFSATSENRLSSDFQDRLLRARLVPVSSLAPRLYRAARTSAARAGKEIEFYMEGGDTEVDRKVIEAVEGPLLHLVRNAVNHGIEPPQVRIAAGKPPAGKIVVAANYEGNQVDISVHDDGGGIDPERVREVAVARGQLDPDTPLSERDAINLIFQQGISTAGAITEESGRGVGLDVVRDAVGRLRGSVEVDSSVGRGSTFTMKFPISLQIARAVLVKVGTQTLAIPMLVVEHIGRLDYYQRVSGPTPALEVRGERYPLTQLASYLKTAPSPVDERSPVLLVNVGRHRVALLVDAIVTQQEVVSKPMGTHLRDVPGVAGATVLGNGQVVLILEMLDLLTMQPFVPAPLPEPSARVAPTAATQPAMSGQMARASAPNMGRMPSQPLYPSQPGARSASAGNLGGLPGAPGGSNPSAPHARPNAMPAFPSASVAPSTGPTGSQWTAVGGLRPAGQAARPHAAVPAAARNSYVLVVDDSPSVRRVVTNMLKANGWETQAARDGIEALEMIAKQAPAAVLLDIEMPRMDGYELIATVRSQETDRHLPLIVLTSRAASKHKQRAVQLGASAYIIKPYQDEELLTILADLVTANG